MAVVFNGKTPSKSEQRDSGHPVLKIKDVDALGRFQGTFSGHVGADLARKHVRQQLTGGETLVLNAAHNATHVASKTFYADQEVAGSLATGEWLIVRWSTETVDSRFGNHWINAPDTRFRLRRLVNGIHLYPKDVARLQIPLPPLAEQKRIAGILDAADALRAKRREALVQLDTLLQSTFLDMFGDPITNPLGWPPTSLSAISDELRDGPFGSNLKSSHYVESGVRVIRLQNIGVGEMLNDDLAYISEEHFASLPHNHCRPGDVIVGTMGDPNLRACIVPPTLARALNKADCILMRVDMTEADPIYACWLLNNPRMVSMALRLVRGQTRGRIGLGRLKELQIHLPPMELQLRFAAIVRSVEAQKASQRAHLAELDTLFASLQSRAFRGDL